MRGLNNEGLGWVRPIAWGVSAALIFLPLMLMKLIDPSAWLLEDLPFAFIMLAAVGLAFEFALRIPVGWTYRAGAAIGVGAAFVLTWGNLAVGFAGSEDNAINIIFFAVPAIAFVGSLVVRFQPHGLVTVMAAAAAAQLTAGVIAFFTGYFTGPLTVSFTGLWIAAALSFMRSSRASKPAESVA